MWHFITQAITIWPDHVTLYYTGNNQPINSWPDHVTLYYTGNNQLIDHVTLYYTGNNQPIKVNDKVRVKPSVTTPTYKWGSVTHRSIGTVTGMFTVLIYKWWKVLCGNSWVLAFPVKIDTFTCKIRTFYTTIKALTVKNDNVHEKFLLFSKMWIFELVSVFRLFYPSFGLIPVEYFIVSRVMFSLHIIGV